MVLDIWTNILFYPCKAEVIVLTLYHTIQTLNNPEKVACRKHCGLVQIKGICRKQMKLNGKLKLLFDSTENIMGKGENAGKNCIVVTLQQDNNS